MGRNAGYAAAINAAAATVRPDSDLLILNPDVRLLPGAARLLVDRLTDSSVGVAVPRILAEDGTTQWSLRREPSLMTAWTDAILGGTLAARIGTGEMIGDPAIYERGGLIEWATGAVLAVAARARSVVGDWDESFFLYIEEVDYMRRVRECGFSVAYVPQAQVVHIGREYLENPRLSALHDRQSNPILPALPWAAVNGCVQAKHHCWRSNTRRSRTGAQSRIAGSAHTVEAAARDSQPHHSVRGQSGRLLALRQIFSVSIRTQERSV